MTKIKICGLFREEDVEYANEAGPDFIGFVFAPSRRRVSAERAARLRSRLAAGIIPVGVFVRAPPEEITRRYQEGLFDMAQLHGDEDGAYIRRLKELSAGTGRGPVPVIKAVRVEGAADLEPWRDTSTSPEVRDAGTPDYLLLDRGGGGTGQAFDWDLLGPGTGEQAGGDRVPVLGQPWFLAGGVSLDTLDRALIYRPFAIDVSSGAETGGIKDREKMIALVKRIREELKR
ncbi:phosphoribosylanthranilate isomerase [Treponema sp. TIM-1]|uniref:phosphoribosylanthranilate isomerase n=1 Tax=Treponema sp. TIM-1 TaxID=2898417 RepID=UPI00397F618E